MKYITLTIFLFLTLIANSQLVMEEISYVPSPSGYYNNLIVKGNAYINEIRTNPLDIQSYGSFLNMTLESPKGIEISSLTVKPDTSIALKNLPDETTPFWHTATTVNVLAGNAGMSFQIDTLTPPYAELEDYHEVKLESFPDSAPYIYSEGNPVYWAGIRNWQINSDKAIYIRGENIAFEKGNVTTSERNNFISNRTYILGMRVPYCDNGYIWKNVQVGQSYFSILACNATTGHN